MNNKQKIVFLFILCVFTFIGRAQNNTLNKQVILFTDREYCVSGDTLWFKVWIPDNMETGCNVVRVQLDSRKGNLIATVAKKCRNGWAEGYIHVPDSLSTGLYLVSPFMNEQRKNPLLKVNGKTLFVYNRFEENIFEIEVPDETVVQKLKENNDVNISVGQEVYKTRRPVSGQVTFSKNNISKAVLSIRMLDPLAHSKGGRFNFEAKSAYPEIPAFSEKNGIVFSGHLSDNENHPEKNKLVLLSITDDPPYFDYCVTGEQGDYHFFLNEAKGKAKVVLQTVSETNNDFVIQPCVNYLKPTSDIPVQSQMLTPAQSEHISELVQGDFIGKLFYSVQLHSPDTFSMVQRYSIPFYGPPSKHIIPDEFIGLPDFREISRELLPGLQYRVRNEEGTFRMINPSQKMIFDNEPLRLLNGIPVFKNNMIASLSSADIDYIDMVQAERIFGDLVFKGILAISLYDKSNSWMAQQPNIFQFDIPCLQVDKSEGNHSSVKAKKNEPDFRQVFLWKILDIKNGNNFSFDLSDLKGQVEITVEGITTDDTLFKTSRIIEVE